MKSAEGNGIRSLVSAQASLSSDKLSLLVKSHILSPHGPACLVLLSPVGLRNSQKRGKMRGWTSDAEMKS